MLILHHPDQALHDPELVFRTGQMLEQPERAQRYHELLASVRQDPHEIVQAPLGGLDPIFAVHDAEYVNFLRTAFARWSAIPGFGPVAVPNVHPTHRMHRKPLDLLGEFGWYSNSTSCAITEGTWPAVSASAAVAVSGADRILAGLPVAYALCRPPGHHAFPDLMTGVCYLNNASIAAHHLARRLGRVAIVDIDAHHPNGTQHIFWERGDVLLCSVHADPNHAPPYYAGYADETGAGAGRGLNCNLPLPVDAGDAAWLDALDHALVRTGEFAPRAVVLCVGFDASIHDSYEPALKITEGGFIEAARRIAALGLPTLIIQEGGYLNPQLGGLLRSFLRAFEERVREACVLPEQGTAP